MEMKRVELRVPVTMMLAGDKADEDLLEANFSTIISSKILVGLLGGLTRS